MSIRGFQGFSALLLIASLILSACTMPGSPTATPELVVAGGITDFFYVTVDGDDDNDCLDWSTACHTIQAVLEKAPFTSGVTIYVGPGTFSDPNPEVPRDVNTHIERDVSIIGAGVGSTILDGENVRIPVFIQGPEDGDLNVIIRDLTVDRGGYSADHNQWGIYVVRANLTLENVIVQNSLDLGIFAPESNLTMDNVTLQRNDGGGLGAGTSTVIRNSNIIDNRDTGIFNAGEMTIENTNISRNRGVNVGGIDQNHFGDLTIINSTIDHNSANYATHSRTSAVQNQFGTMTIINSTISNNSFGPGTSGMALSNRGEMELRHVTIANNEGGGVVDWEGTGNYFNTLIVNNGSRDCDIRPTGYAPHVFGVNIDSDGWCARNRPEFQTYEDPMIGPLQINRGADTQTHALLPGSPAIDASTVCPEIEDQTEFRRDGHCDVGAYEFDITDTAMMTSGDQPDVPRLTQDDLCLSGPGQDYLVHSSLPQGLEVELVGIGEQPGWLVLSHPNFPEIKCWVPEDHIEIPDPQILTNLPTLQIPLKPTLTPIPTKTPEEVCYDENNGQIPCP